MLPSLDRSIPSRVIDDHIILQSGGLRGATGHTQPKEVVSNFALP